jgi:RNA polymerase sigma factor (sigma-70 family)
MWLVTVNMIACRLRSPDLCYAGTSDFRARDGAVHRRVEMISAGETEGALRHVLEAELQRYHQESFGWALTCCRWVATEAEEVLQETYLKVLDGRARFDGRSHFKTWLFAVLRRTAAERRRKVHLWRVVPWSWWGSGPGAISVDPGVEMARSEASAQLLAALATLPERQQQMLHLVFYQELSIQAAATVLGVQVGTARVHYERGKQRLRTLLQQGD